MMQNEFILGAGEDIEFLKTAFPEVEFNLYRAMVKENVFMSAFSCRIENEEILEQLWSRINSLIGAEYQTQLLDEFSSWNIYLAFFIPKQVSNVLKYNIENDTFFVRKIVFDSNLEDLEKEVIAINLNSHILGKDISIESQSIQEVISVPEYSSITKRLLSTKLPLGRTGNDKKLRQAWLDKAILEVDNDEI